MKAFCPFHITGFFALKLEREKISSDGCGVVIADGATTEAFAGNGSVYINGTLAQAPTTETVAASLSDKKSDIRTELAGPISCGLGTSGAGALSTALSLNELWGLKRSFNELCDVAQRAEIANKTGVGDVVAQAIGGIVIRHKNAVDRIPTPPLEISYVVFGPLPTPEILADRGMITVTNKLGSAALRKLMERPTLDEFMRLSWQFACDSELISQKARDAVEAVEASEGLASMAMLGDAVYAIDPANALSEFGTVQKTTICNRGAHLVL
ncbi:MAG: GHMP kinase [Halobacteriota archaeon]|jgi:pantoate kinase